MASLLTFRELTRSGIPAFRVCRVPLVTQGVEIAVGAVIAPDTFSRTRVQQLYEQRMIAPVSADGGVVESRSAETFRKAHEAAQATQAQAELEPAPLAMGAGLPFDLPAVEVDEQSEQSGYRPPNTRASRRAGATGATRRT